jgi:hypothetical protein
MVFDDSAVLLPGTLGVWAAAGVVLLLLGRRVFWLVLGLLGFVAGLGLAGQWLAGRPPWLALAVGVAAGLVGAVLAVFLQKVAVAVAGFLVGGAAGLWLAAQWSLAAGGQVLAFLLAAILAAILALWLFDWAVVAVSAAAGAVLLLRALELRPAAALLAFAVLALVGVAVQARGLERRR